MKIIVTYDVKQILTEQSRASYFNKWQKERGSLQQEIEHLQFEMKRLQKKRPADQTWIAEQFEKEIRSRTERMSFLDFKVDQLEELSLGSEIHDGEIESIQHVQVGDQWYAREQKGKIVVKDGIVQSIVPDYTGKDNTI
ncbi:YlqD family protein [Bacillus sp. RAR_GA_16]|uniref:YlqD family protein n=1 Tax=Bacillus sp. RAR_GA_16 TaxID=2876774 RepID=UPI001CC9B146|nr:YlqD family protein [Bacillus sp. RAR_GA_16]MCA0174332.1 YlqD family protein [Bacillus sp. RAR_GA_16]